MDTTAHAADGLLDRLEQLHQIGIALSRERDTGRLLESILLAAMRITRADGGTLYRVTDDAQALRFEIMHTDSLGLALGGAQAGPVPFAPLPLYRSDGAPNDSLVAAYAVIHDRTINIADAYQHEAFDFSGTRAFDARTGYRSRSFLTVPMKNHEGTCIGVLQLINAQPPGAAEKGGAAAVEFSTSDQRLAESLASQAAIAISNRQLIEQLEVLFESFISLINLAIDEKSPYTGGHCQRVPVLTMLLAEAADATDQGPLSDFRMSGRDRYELKIAGLLHDCGKITTPVHVVDKATKLQTLYDRIGLIDTRFEVLRRDAEIAALRRQLALRPVADARAEAAAEQEMQTVLHAIERDRDFLRMVNLGAESMADAQLDRVRDIAQRHRWRGPDGAEQPFLTDDELENLSIRAGTLTQREREIINHHIVATIKMLEQLPWPSHLRNVPEYAGGHHERMDGKGYPRGLTREQMSWQARMMGIADIFEALTAVDRPYKSGMTLSCALGIMRKFKHGGHIDADLFDVFVRCGVYLEYAQQFLEPWQIDAVDEQALLA
ncbi:GAF domain-containing protein [Ramlibacter sp. H39-3-26]|uniref:HD family phosphohydrolase n=1 Tax=Curvibacter soli TaxID=3031331 RepID=UPI0023D9A04D|nr:HD family phosphohydrolase [Ramlibacter sp. H39-3-26]MDF1486672.1 GAF domain-containing protein [Ramlibacter sp. H39-3-26]